MAEFSLSENLSIFDLLNISACASCRECYLYCPVYDVDRRSALTPREKLKNLISILKKERGLLASLFGPRVKDEEIKDFLSALYECSVCAQCREVCPAGIDTPKLWERIRANMVSSGYGPLPQQKTISQSIRNYDNPWMQPRGMRGKWAERAFKEGRISRPVQDITKNRAKVLYYVGCTASYDQNITEVAINFVELMNIAGIEFGILGPREKCCGSTPLRIGDYATFEQQAIANIELFTELKVDTVVFSCSGCFKTMNQDYREVKRLPFRTLHLVQFLLELMEEKKLVPVKEVPLKITYHDPCHLGRHNKLYEEPREILRRIPGIELIEMKRSREFSRCCGAGGGVKAGFPHINNAMTDMRIEDAEGTGADELVTACPFCYQSLQLGIQRKNSYLKIRDVTELLIRSVK
jgi:heterodisulfide reductase subunit D